jgi:mRNA interferase RelE/StbE
MYKVELAREAEKVLKSLSEKDQIKILNALEGLEEDPSIGKKLQGSLKGLRVIRVWPYRVVYTVYKKTVTVTVLTIGHRKDVYKKAKRRMR